MSPIAHLNSSQLGLSHFASLPMPDVFGHTGTRRSLPYIRTLIRASMQHNQGRFPCRTDVFNVPGLNETWIAIDSALYSHAIAPSPEWDAHQNKMRTLGCHPSLASLNPAYRPLKKESRSIHGILAQIVAHIVQNEGEAPRQKTLSAPLGGSDTWQAICKALRVGSIVNDPQWHHYQTMLAGLRASPSLASLLFVFSEQIQAEVNAKMGRPLPIFGRNFSQAPRKSAPRNVDFAGILAPLMGPPLSTSHPTLHQHLVNFTEQSAIRAKPNLSGFHFVFRD